MQGSVTRLGERPRVSFFYGDDMKYRYSVRFINKSGDWQEEDAFESEIEANEVKEKVMARENRETKVVDLEKTQEDTYY